MSNPQEEQGLMLGDRINWPYILGMSILKVDEAIVREEGNQSEQQVREAVLSVYNKIPDAWVENDVKWKEDIAEAIITKKIDDRPLWCGIRVGKPKWKKEEVINPHRLLRACVNVFQRRSLLSKTIFQEQIVPVPEDLKETEEELEREQDVNDPDRTTPL